MNAKMKTFFLLIRGHMLLTGGKCVIFYAHLAGTQGYKVKILPQAMKRYPCVPDNGVAAFSNTHARQRGLFSR